jgi:hypothetical protein
MDLGPPESYLALEHRTPVFSSDGVQVGHVTRVLGDEEEDVFDGIVIEDHLGPGGHRFVAADDIDDIYRDGVLLKLDREQAAHLPEPPPSTPVIHEDPADTGKRSLSQRLKRAWHDVSGTN